MEQRAQVGVECPQCHWRHFLEMEVDARLLHSPLAAEIKRHLEEWMLSRCPNHLGTFVELSRN